VAFEFAFVALGAERHRLLVDVEADRPAALAARILPAALGADERLSLHRLGHHGSRDKQRVVASSRSRKDCPQPLSMRIRHAENQLRVFGRTV